MLYHYSTGDKISLCKIHLYYYLGGNPDDISEDEINDLYNTKCVSYSLYSAVVLKLFGKGANKELIYDYRNSLVSNLSDDYRSRGVPDYEDQARKTENLLCNTLCAIMVESFYSGVYEKEICEISCGYDKDYSNDADKNVFEYVREKLTNAIKGNNEEEFKNIYSTGINNIIDEDLLSKKIKDCWNELKPKQSRPIPIKPSINAFFSDRLSSVFAIFKNGLHSIRERLFKIKYKQWKKFGGIVLAFLCAIMAYKAFEALSALNESSRITFIDEGENKDSQEADVKTDEALCHISSEGVISFQNDDPNMMIRYKICSSQKECSIVDWTKPDGIIKVDKLLFAKRSCWLAIKGYSDQGDEIEVCQEIDFCDILTSLFRSDNIKTLEKMIDEKSMYSKDNELPIDTYLKNYIHSRTMSVDFGPQGGYRVTDYSYADNQDGWLFDFQSKSYPKLKEISINK